MSFGRVKCGCWLVKLDFIQLLPYKPDIYWTIIHRINNSPKENHCVSPKISTKKKWLQSKQPLKTLHLRVYLYTTAKYLIISRCTSRCRVLFFIPSLSYSSMHLGNSRPPKTKQFTIISHQLESYKVSRMIWKIFSFIFL